MREDSRRDEWKSLLLTHLALLGAVALWVTVAVGLRVYCPIRHVTGIPCPGCGMSRALVCLLRGDWKGYAYYNPALLPCLTAVFFLINRETILLRRLPMWVKDAVIFLDFACAVVTYAVRLMFFEIP